MLANLVASLIAAEAITTTEAKAKALRPVAEKIITKAKKGGLHNHRQVVSFLRDKEMVMADVRRSLDQGYRYIKLHEIGEVEVGAAREVAGDGVQVNALGTNFMDFPAFLEASGATDPDVRARIEGHVPLKRLGTLEECAALAAAYLDGTCGFVTGQFVAHDGGWS